MPTRALRDRPSRTVMAGDGALDVRVRESVRARRLRVTVGPDHPLEVVVPPGTRDRAVDRFLRSKREWIARNVALAEEIAARPGQLGLDRQGTAFVHGAPVPVKRVAGRRPVARLAGGRVIVGGGTPAQAATALERLYRRLAREAARETADREAVRLGLEYRSIGIGDQRTRWGSCSTQGRLSFSWRLVLASREVLDYVVVHELCHLRHPHHRQSFWRMVERAWPGHAEQERWLREHGRELQRYRPAVSVAAG